jgi:hypothetical protein
MGGVTAPLRHDGSAHASPPDVFAPPPPEIGVVLSAECERASPFAIVGCGVLVAGVLAVVVAIVLSLLVGFVGGLFSNEAEGFGEWVGLFVGAAAGMLWLAATVRGAIAGPKRSLSYIGSEGVAWIDELRRRVETQVVRFPDVANVEVDTERIAPSGRIRVQTTHYTCRIIGNDGTVLRTLEGDADTQTESTLYTTAGDRHVTGEARMIIGIRRAFDAWRGARG